MRFWKGFGVWENDLTQRSDRTWTGSSLSRAYGSCFGVGGCGRRFRWWEKRRAAEGKASMRCLMFGLSDIFEVTAVCLNLTFFICSELECENVFKHISRYLYKKLRRKKKLK